MSRREEAICPKISFGLYANGGRTLGRALQARTRTEGRKRKRKEKRMALGL
jgi:hypothetical protein